MNENKWPPYWGHLFTPYEFVPIVEAGRLWVADNGVFTRGFDWKEMRTFLEKMEEHKETCLFVVVPDSVGNSVETLCMYRHWAWRIKDMGWPIAFVGQDGQENLPMPEYDALFIGGTTDWKMGRGARRCIWQAQKRDKWVHVGRVNTQRRIAYFQMLGVDSVDGTCLTFGPEINRWRLEKQLAQLPLLDFTSRQ